MVLKQFAKRSLKPYIAYPGKFNVHVEWVKKTKEVVQQNVFACFTSVYIDVYSISAVII